MFLVSWNVNGVRSIIKKDFLKDIKTMSPDVLCLQETKAPLEEVKTVGELLPNYKLFANSSKSRKGYSGTAVFSKSEPLNVVSDINIDYHDQEGRVITVEFPDYYLVNVYTPNSGDGLARLEYRQEWDRDFRQYLLQLKEKKPVIVCGDLNVAHHEIDIARAKQNFNKAAGYTQQEIDGFQQLVDAGFIDTFRHLHPDEVKYTYWNYLFNARARNVGWRIDYFLVTEPLVSRVEAAEIYNEYQGSDHCPVGLRLR